MAILQETEMKKKVNVITSVVIKIDSSSHCVHNRLWLLKNFFLHK